MSDFLTFEWDKKNEKLEIHGNAKGLKLLRTQIDNLLKSRGNDHVHMMVPSWGGDELSEEKQCVDNTLINHVKIFKWD